MAYRRPLTTTATAALAALAPPSTALAGSTACWFENGAVVVPASLDLPSGAWALGDWLIDVAAPATLLHETRAQMEGVEGEATTGDLRLAGERVAALPVAVADLDARAPGFTTPIVGVIGEDVLSRYVVDIEFSPCRVTFHRASSAPPLAGQVLPLTMVEGRPTVTAAVADGEKAVRGPFVVDTASKAAVRLVLPDPHGPKDGDPRQGAPHWIRAVSFAGRLYEKAPAARGAELPPQVLGAVGTEVLSRYRLRIDVPHGRLVLAPPRKP